MASKMAALAKLAVGLDVGTSRYVTISGCLGHTHHAHTLSQAAPHNKTTVQQHCVQASNCNLQVHSEQKSNNKF